MLILLCINPIKFLVYCVKLLEYIFRCSRNVGYWDRLRLLLKFFDSCLMVVKFLTCWLVHAMLPSSRLLLFAHASPCQLSHHVALRYSCQSALSCRASLAVPVLACQPGLSLRVASHKLDQCAAYCFPRGALPRLPM